MEFKGTEYHSDQKTIKTMEEPHQKKENTYKLKHENKFNKAEIHSNQTQRR